MQDEDKEEENRSRRKAVKCTKNKEMDHNSKVTNYGDKVKMKLKKNDREKINKLLQFYL